MAIAFSSFDKRNYRTLGVREGYGAWAPTYEATVLDLMDLRLLERLDVDWPRMESALDLACGTGRVGVWLKARGVKRLCGVDFAAEMLDRAREKGVYDLLVSTDIASTRLDERFDLITMSLADEHLPSLAPFYREARRLATPGGTLVVVGYHPHFIMLGMPTHFNGATGEPLAVETHVHLTGDHIAAARGAGFELAEMVEGVIDDAWLAAKPKWQAYRNHPISFAMVWTAAR